MIDEKPIECPHCGRVNTLHSGVDPKDIPKENDYSICFKCKLLSVYFFHNEILKLRKPTEEESMTIIKENPEFKAAMHALYESYNIPQALELWRNS